MTSQEWSPTYCPGAYGAPPWEPTEHKAVLDTFSRNSSCPCTEALSSILTYSHLYSMSAKADCSPQGKSKAPQTSFPSASLPCPHKTKPTLAFPAQAGSQAHQLPWRRSSLGVYVGGHHGGSTQVSATHREREAGQPHPGPRQTPIPAANASTPGQQQSEEGRRLGAGTGGDADISHADSGRGRHTWGGRG